MFGGHQLDEWMFAPMQPDHILELFTRNYRITIHHPFFRNLGISYYQNKDGKIIAVIGTDVEILNADVTETHPRDVANLISKVAAIETVMVGKATPLKEEVDQQ